MDRKELNWHGKNMEVVCKETANNRELAYIYAVANATRWILTVMEKEHGKEAKDRVSEANTDKTM